jgi:hypothetical protein
VSVVPNKSSSGSCDLCGHFVAVCEKAHIVAEQPKRGDNLLMLCPSCHVMFDRHIKPKVFRALKKAGVKGIPGSWATSIYEQAAEASMAARRKSKGT